MNIHGIGTEIVECVRIGRLIAEHGELFLDRIYTAREVGECQSRPKSTEEFAARWAAKEAVLKAIGMEGLARVGRTSLEIRRHGRVRPEVFVRGVVRDEALRLKISEIRVSFSACRNYATATAIALTHPERTTTNNDESIT